RAAVQAARRLAELPTGRFPRPDRSGSYVAWASSLDRSYYLPQLLHFAAVLAAADGNDEDAIVLSVAMINWARSAGDEVSGKAAYTRSRGAGDAVDTLERVLALTRPSENALAAVQKHLAVESRQRLLLRHFRYQRAVFDHSLEWMIDGQFGV